MSTSIKPPFWFWVVSIFALLWNAGGVFTYLDTAFNQVAMLEEMTQAQRELFENFPAWATGAFAMAVFSGLFASIGLLLRKKWAKPLFILSLLMAVAQFIQWLFVQNAAEAFGNEAYFMPAAVVILGLLFILFANKSRVKNWIS